MNLTLTQLLEVMPGLTQQRASEHLQYLNDTMATYEINTPLRVCHYLAQLGHESESLLYTHELGNDAYFEKYENRADLGNTEEGDGVKYKGRGFIQITGKTNYRMYGNVKGIDFVSNPELLEQEPYCSDSSGFFWQEHSLNVFADADNIYTITRRINGALNGLNDRERRLFLCKKVLLNSIINS